MRAGSVASSNEMRREIDSFFRGSGWKNEPAARGIELPGELRLDEVPAAARELCEALQPQEGADARRSVCRAQASTDRLVAACRTAEAGAEALRSGLLGLANQAAAEVRAIDFGLLFDADGSSS